MMELEEFLATSGLELRTVELWISREWLIPHRNGPKTAFDDIDAARARLIRELQADFGVNDEGVDVVLHLFDQLNGMRRAMAEIRVEFLRSGRTASSPDSRPGAKKRP